MKFVNRILPLCAALALGGSLLGAAEIRDTPIHLLVNEKFTPVKMFGMDSAARGWSFHDPSREAYIRNVHTYISGEECFKLTFDADGMTIRFADPLAACHRQYRMPCSLRSRIASQIPPAPQYRTTGRVRFNKGSLRVVGGPALKPAEGWQTIDFTGKEPGQVGTGFIFPAVPGAEYTFGELCARAIYPEVGGEIALPDGGKLDRLLLAEDADYIMRWSVAMWRGWLWRLTGVALPIETVKEVKPTPGAFAAVKGETADGGWQLTVGKEGITLVYCETAAIVPALYDYLRLGLKCGFYAPDCIRKPADGSVKELPAIARVAKPRFRFFTCGTPWILTSGGWDPTTLYARNDVDYYHLFAPKWDHTMNIIMPGEIYFPKHPEYFMLAKNGKRYLHYNPYYTNPCFSSAGAMKTLVDNLLKYTDEQPLYRRITMATGDVSEHCQCPECIKVNGGPTTNSDSQMLFLNILSKEFAKRYPDKIIIHDIYASRHTVPKNVRNEALDNVNYFYCLTPNIARCTVHVDCEANKELIEEIRGWQNYIGGKRQLLGFMTYNDLRPLRHLRQMEYLNQFGSGEVYFFDWHGFPQAAHFCSARWNLGEDADKLMEEFDLNYYGAAGPAMHKITLLVDEFTRNYKHQPEDYAEGNHHFGVWGGLRRETRTVLTREVFDEIYRLFDEAMAAVKGDKVLETRIVKEIKLYMAADLNRYNVTRCRNEKDLKEFAGRLERYIRLAQKYRSVFNNVSIGVEIRKQINDASGMVIPEGGFWADKPVVKRFLADPMKFFVANVEKIPGGWYYRPLTIRGGTAPTLYGYECPPRQSIGIRRPRFSDCRASIVLKLDRKPAAPLLLALEGLDDDKPGTSLMEVSVNGKVIFSGKNLFPEHSWGRMGFTLPADALTAGENTITIANITPDTPTRSALYGDSDKGKADGQWGWVMLSEAYVLDPAGDFERFAQGDAKQRIWHLAYAAAPPPADKQGEVVTGNGKVVLKGVAGSPTGISYFAIHTKPKIAVAPGSKVRITVEAAGKGKLRGELWCYRPQPGTAKKAEIPAEGYCGKTSGTGRNFPRSKPVELAAAPRTIVFDFTAPAAAGLVIPRVELVGAGEATLTKLAVEVTPPATK